MSLTQEQVITDLQLQVEQLKLEKRQTEMDLDDTLYVVYRTLNIIGLDFSNIRSAQLKTVIKGINKAVFNAASNPEEFGENFKDFHERALAISIKYEEHIKQLVEARKSMKS